MKVCYHYIKTSIPVSFIGVSTFEKLFSDHTHLDISFPISVGFSIYPLGSVVALFQVLFKAIPWFYVGLWPAQPNVKLHNLPKNHHQRMVEVLPTPK